MRKLWILFLPVFFWGCTSQPKIVPVKLQAEELEVIKQTFPQDYCCKTEIYEAPMFPPKGWHQAKGEKQRLKKLRDSVSRLKSERQIWFVKDTLYNPAQLKFGTKYYYKPQDKLDTGFYILEKSLFTKLYPSQPAKLAGLIIRKQIFQPIDSAKTSTQTQKHYVTLSRVVFNSTHDKACYYFSQGFTQPDRNWAEEQMMFAEKRQGKWHLIYRKLYSIT